MKKVKTLLTTGAAAAAIALSATPAMAELEASASVASSYLFRGIEQGDGAQVSGDITYSMAGFYASAWISSTGLANNGSGTEEVDFIAGYGAEFGGVSLDIGVIDYYYPGLAGADALGDLIETYVGAGFAGVELYYYTATRNEGGQNYDYFTLSYGMGKWSALLGYADLDEASGQSYDDDYYHLDVTYAFNDNLSFTVSQTMSADSETDPDDADYMGGATWDNDTHFVVSYSIPLN